MRYEYECEGHERKSFIMSVKEHEEFKPICAVCGKAMEQLYFPLGSYFNYKPGRETGVYDYDYGKKATWDLTPPGKMERLKKEGVVRDSF